MAGILLLALGLALAILAAWMFSKTLGTALLFTDARIGKLVKHYWIVFIAAVACLAIGFALVRIKGKAKAAAVDSPQEAAGTDAVIAESDSPGGETAGMGGGEAAASDSPQEAAGTDAMIAESDSPQEAAAGADVETVAAEERQAGVCPQCGKPIKEGALFCIYCGKRLEE